MSQSAPPRPGRSFELKILILSLLVLSLTSWLRLHLVILDWSLLPELGASASPWYLVVSAALWGFLSLVSAVGLAFRQRWAPPLTRVAVMVLALWYWIDRLMLDQTPLAQQNWPFATGLTMACLVFVFAVLALPAQKEYFKP